MLKTEERILAGLAHLSALAMGMGLALPVAFWQENRGKSKYVAFQSLQAIGYQSLGYTLWMLTYLTFFLVMYIVFFIVLLAFDRARSEAGPANVFLAIWLFISFLLIFVFFGAYLLTPVIAAVACFLGRDFRYPFMGRLAGFLEYDFSGENPINQTHAERWVASMSHFAVLHMLWGMLAPLVVLVLNKTRSAYLRFQSAQTLVYQGLGTAVYFAVIFVYMVAFFSLIGLGAARGDINRIPTEALLTFGIFMMCVVAIFLLIIPAYHILGQWAGLRTLQGHDYRYPFIGRLVARWLETHSAAHTSIPTDQEIKHENFNRD